MSLLNRKFKQHTLTAILNSLVQINMKPLFILIVVFAISLLILKLCNVANAYSLSGRIAMSVMLVFTAFGHFAFPKGMAAMLPGIIPIKTEVIYITGVIE